MVKRIKYDSIPIRDNWKHLYDMLQVLNKKLEQPSEDHWLPDYIEKAQKEVENILGIIKNQKLYVIGSTYINKNLSFINIRLKGLVHALEEDNLSKFKALRILKETREGLTGMISEVSVKLDKQLLAKVVQEARKIHAVDINSDNYKNLTNDMQSIVRKSENLDGLSNSDKASTRDALNIARIMQINQSDLQQMKLSINKSKTDKNDDENFILLKGPVLTGAQFDINRLNSSGITYNIVYFPGINYGFVKKEASPRFYILRDQMLAAIVVGRRNRFQLKLKNKPLEKTIKQDNQNFKEMSSDVVQLLEQKLGYAVVNIGAEREAYITNKNFPGIRFMWLMPKSTYQKLGPFSSSTTLELPF